MQEKLCHICPNPVKDKRNKFCSRSCAASFNNKGVRRNGNDPWKECPNCGTATTNPKFCCSYCHNQYRNDTRTWLILEDEQPSSDESTVRKLMTTHLIERDGHKCTRCNTEVWMGQPIPLTCDHIDGNSENNYPSNFRMICANCDRQSDTYGFKNAGNGRASRRKQKA